MTGKVLLAAYVVLASIQEVYFSHLFQTSDPIAVLGLMILVTVLIAAILMFARTRTPPKWNLKANWRDYAALNFSSVVSWLGFFLSLRYIEPAIASIICFMLGPCLLVLSGRVESRKVDRALAMGLVFVTAGLFVVTYMGLGAMSLNGVEGVIYGFSWALVSAIGIVFNTVYSKRLSQNSVSENQILFIRFIGLLLLTFTIAPAGSVQAAVDQTGIIQLVVLAGVTFYVPVWILQMAITRERNLVISYGLSLIPAVTFFLQMLDPRFSFSIASLTFILAGTVISLVGAWRKEKVNE